MMAHLRFCWLLWRLWRWTPPDGVSMALGVEKGRREVGVRLARCCCSVSTKFHDPVYPFRFVADMLGRMVETLNRDYERTHGGHVLDLSGCGRDS